MASQAPLALGYGWRKNEDLIDALPYVDPLTPEDKRAVEKLIEEEVVSMSPHWIAPILPCLP